MNSAEKFNGKTPITLCCGKDSPGLEAKEGGLLGEAGTGRAAVLQFPVAQVGLRRCQYRDERWSNSSSELCSAQ
jgi:hypothetical protein